MVNDGGSMIKLEKKIVFSATGVHRFVYPKNHLFVYAVRSFPFVSGDATAEFKHGP